MNGRFLLDTNIVIALFKEEPDVLKSVAAADELFVPVVVIGELHYGARKSGQIQLNISRIEDFEAVASVLSVDTATAEFYGVIKESLRAKGRPIPENDIWIAASARRHDLILVTRDEHFAEIPDLKLVRW